MQKTPKHAGLSRRSARCLGLVAVVISGYLADAAATLAQVDSPEYLSQVEAGRAALEEADYAGAIAAFEAASRMGGSRQRESWAALGWLYTRIEERMQALRAYQQLYALAPGESIEHLRALTEAYRRVDRPEETIEPCREFINRARDDSLRAYAYNELGYWLIERDGNLPETLNHAAASFREALALSGGRANPARFNLAEVLARQGRADESRNTIDSLVAAAEAQPWQSLRPTRPAAAAPPHVRQVKHELLARSRAKPPAPRQTQPGTLHVGGDVRKPEKISAPQPSYTREARAAKVQGVIIAQAVIDEQGRVTAVKILKGLPYGLSESAAATMRTWRFKPATLNGQPVAVYYNLTVNFRLR